MHHQKTLKFALTLLICLLFLNLNAQDTATFRIFEKPIVYNKTRKKLSLDYLKNHYGIIQKKPHITPKMIVLHWTEIPNLELSFDAMNPATLPENRKGIAAASNLNVSAQFLIDRDGTIFRQLPDTAFARHVIGLNYCAIGVENVGGSKAPLTEAQIKANEDLIRYLKHKYPEIEYVIGHYEYTDFENTSLWKEKDNRYRTVKTDPGEDFMRRIRKAIADLNLKGSPKQNH
ncbi:N-acetylmuramoyl-L-alanine amidase [Zhouia sp. PK063]|uniref:N-acetylmuramoyl-L-alanine amidase n=1 Tax=Zhouia sp. PK063 TaxID=3373602 RepID=UPI0037932F21